MIAPKAPSSPSWLNAANAQQPTKESKEATPLLNNRISVDQLPEYHDLDEDCCCCSTDPVLWWFSVFHLVAALVALAALAMNAVYLCSSISQLALRDILLRVYTILLYLVMFFIEFDWRYLMKRLRIMDLWVIRGLFYVFLGLIMVAEESVANPVNIIAFTVMAVGVVYFTLGVLCMKQFKMKYVIERIEKSLSQREEETIVSV